MVQILDTTLREGEQTPNVTFSVNEKIIIANLLDEFGVDIIEAGHPSVSQDVYNGIKEITKQGYNAEILAHTRALKEDIDKAISCEVDWVGIFLCVEKQRLQQQFQYDLDRAIEIIIESIEYAKEHGLKVRYTPEDATRTKLETLIQAIKSAEEANADRISIADTVGAITPFQMYQLIKKIKTVTDLKINVHCHNDLGLATANSLAAYEAGVSTIDVTVNGLGERVGITPLSEIIIPLHHIYKAKNNWRLELLPEISKKVAEFSGIGIPKNAPIIGENAFVHKAGLHVSAVVKNPEFYEAFPAELIGRERDFSLDKMAGRPTIKKKLELLGIPKNDSSENKLINYVKSKEKGTISDNEIFKILDFPNLNNNFFQKCI
jgi:2-isopropylmalate synthase